MTHSPVPMTSVRYLATLRILFYALLAGQLIFLVITFVLRSTGSFGAMPELEKIFVYIAAVLVAGGVIAGRKIYTTRIQALKAMPKLADQLNGYRAAMIIRCALLEGPVLFTIICYLLTGNQLLPGLAAITIAIFVTLRPGKEKLVRELELSSGAIAIVNNPDAVVG